MKTFNLKNAIYALLFTAMVSCQSDTEKNVDYVLFSGTVSNSETAFITVFNSDFKQKIAINKDDHTFSDTLRIPTDGAFSFRISPESSSFYLKKGDVLNLTIDAKQFDESITYTGKGATRNNFLAKNYLLEEKNMENFRAVRNLSPQDFTKELKSRSEKSEALLNASDLKENDIIEIVKTENKYARLINLFSFQHAVAKNEKMEVPADFFKELSSLDIDNEIAYKSSASYRQLVYSIIEKKITDAIAANSALTYDTEFVNIIKSLKSTEIKNALLKMLVRNISTSNENAEQLKNDIVALTTNQELKDEATKKFTKIQKLLKGNPSPLFTDYENYDGSTTSLTDFKGKYVYVDLWATWCGPCLREVPSFKKVEEKFRNKNIAFVSISVDQKSAYKKWRKMVEEKELSGIHLFDKSQEASTFTSDYMVNTIPRYILIDPKGNIVNADAPRPSQTELEELLTSLL